MDGGGTDSSLVIIIVGCSDVGCGDGGGGGGGGDGGDSGDDDGGYSGGEGDGGGDCCSKGDGDGSGDDESCRGDGGMSVLSVLPLLRLKARHSTAMRATTAKRVRHRRVGFFSSRGFFPHHYSLVIINTFLAHFMLISTFYAYQRVLC